MLGGLCPPRASFVFFVEGFGRQFRLGDTLQRTVDVQQASTLNKDKLKIFCHINVNSMTNIYLSLRDDRNICGYIFGNKVECLFLTKNYYY